MHVEGFDLTQIWEQARKILNASNEETETALREGSLPRVVNPESKILPGASGDDDNREGSLESGDGWDPDRGSEADEVGQLDDEEVEKALRQDRQNPVTEGGSADTSSIEDDRAGENDGRNDGESSESAEDSGRVIQPDKYGLNDAFFSIDDFNKQSQLLEQQDARGEPIDEDASEDEAIDWSADPLKARSSQDERPLQGNSDGEQDSADDDDDDGPTFGNADLDASDSEQDLQVEDVDVMQNTNDIRYDDFFAPPARVGNKKTHRRALPKTQPPAQSIPQTELDIQRTISGVRRDIFEDDVSPGEQSDEAPSDASAHGQASGRSSHQRRQAALAAEIRRLEAANVAKRDWTLSGEAGAADRPINSLLEEDLDFERAGKPIPVITNEVSEDIEALIKRRIIAREFDEVIRRRPDNLVTGDRVRRGRFELDDTKPQQGLAEIYEAEHLKKVDPEGYVDPDNAKLKEQHAAIEALWKEVSAKLDGLSSLHFKPKPPTATINVVADVPAIMMEDARPTAGGAVDGTSMLAPQEVYQVGQDRTREERVREVVRKGGAVVGREEMERDERKRARRREKERARKRGGVEGKKKRVGDVKEASAKSEKAQRKRDETKQVEATLKRGGVRLIDRKGEIRDVQGRKMTIGPGTRGSGASFRL